MFWLSDWTVKKNSAKGNSGIYVEKETEKKGLISSYTPEYNEIIEGVGD